MVLLFKRPLPILRLAIDVRGANGAAGAPKPVKTPLCFAAVKLIMLL